MDEREELLYMLRQIRALVAELTASLPFNEKMSQYLDRLNEAIERMENKQ